MNRRIVRPAGLPSSPPVVSSSADAAPSPLPLAPAWNGPLMELAFRAERPLRRSALIAPWGVGAIVEFPRDEALMTAGLDAWPGAFAPCPPEWKVTEERLQKRLGVEHFRLPTDWRKPGTGGGNSALEGQSVPFVRFPQWHLCPFCGTMELLGPFEQQKRCPGVNWTTQRSCFSRHEKKRPFLVPVRWVAICRRGGHIEDVPWMEWAHQDWKAPTDSCRLRFKTGATGVSFSAIRLECRCGAERALTGLLNKNSLERVGARCCGARPWLGETAQSRREQEAPPCGAALQVVPRTATNVYFAHVVSSLYLPTWGQNQSAATIETLMDEHTWNFLSSSLDEDNRIALKRCEMLCESRRYSFSPEELRAVAQARLDGSRGAITVEVEGARIGEEDDLSSFAEEEAFRAEEYEALCQTQTLGREWNVEVVPGENYGPGVSEFFESVSLVHSLRETRVLCGFSRGWADDGRELKARREALRLSSSLDWLPANVTLGEGVFLRFKSDKMNEWLARPEAVKRAKDLIARLNQTRAERGSPRRPLSPKFLVLHSFAHLLINQLVFECGYSASSLRERIYCDSEGETRMDGVLIYTASGDGAGTLGGLVRAGTVGRLEATLLNLREKGKWCSFDPVCSEQKLQGPDGCNGAACYGCSLVPETSCEEGNRLLDRVAVVGKPGELQLGYFYLEHL